MKKRLAEVAVGEWVRPHGGDWFVVTRVARSLDPEDPERVILSGTDATASLRRFTAHRDVVVEVRDTLEDVNA